MFVWMLTFPPPLASAATKCIIDTSPVNCPTCAVTAPSRQCNYITNFWPTSLVFPTQHPTIQSLGSVHVENLGCQRDFAEKSSLYRALSLLKAAPSSAFAHENLLGHFAKLVFKHSD